MNYKECEVKLVDSEHVSQVGWNNIGKQKILYLIKDNPKNQHLELLGLVALIQIQSHRLT